MNEWIEWAPGDDKPHPDTDVHVRFRSGVIGGPFRAGGSWTHTGGNSDIVAYKLSGPERIAPVDAADPRWVAWYGGRRPCNAGCLVCARLRDGRTVERRAHQFQWDHSGHTSDIVGYFIVEASPVDFADGDRPPIGATGASARQVAGTHYKDMDIQPWDVVDTWPLEQRIGFYRGGALKYLMRMGAKDESAQEISKGQHYLEKLLEVLKEQTP